MSSWKELILGVLAWSVIGLGAAAFVVAVGYVVVVAVR